MFGLGINRDDQEIIERLVGFRLLKGVDPKAVRRIAKTGRWFCVPGGMELIRAGDTDRALFFVFSGTISVEVDDGRGLLECIAHIPPGETVGEMSLLSDEPHSARLFAHRDTELFMLDRAAFEAVAAIDPRLMRNLSLLLIDRLRRTTLRVATRHAGRSIALIATEDTGRLMSLASQLVTALWAMGVKATCLDHQDANRPGGWYHAIEAQHDIVFFLAGPEDVSWLRQAERQTDRVILVGAGPDPRGPDRKRASGQVERVYLGAMAAGRPQPGGSADAGVKHLVRPGDRADIARLARFVSGRAVGLVLSGGGARGFTHLGIVKALSEAGVPIDAAGGTSMGAIIAAGIATQWPAEEQAERMRAAFVASNPISDITMPTVAFFGGRKVRRLMEEHFGARRIEELALPYFCVTSDLTDGRDIAHNNGLLSEKLRASVALPGLLPPVVLDDHLHVDGAVMNNLPVDHMARLTGANIIAVDVTGDCRLAPGGGKMPAPNIVSILIRSGTVGNEFQRREAQRAAKLLFEPPVDAIGFRDWQSFDRAIEIGYRHAVEVLTADPGLLKRLDLTGAAAAA